MVPVGAMIGIAATDIPDTETGELAVVNVYNVPKLDAAVIAAGEAVMFDESLGVVDDESATPATDDIAGFGVAWESKGSTTGESIAVLLTPGSGVLEP